MFESHEVPSVVLSVKVSLHLHIDFVVSHSEWSTVHCALSVQCVSDTLASNTKVYYCNIEKHHVFKYQHFNSVKINFDLIKANIELF
jgi:hypothetical protein